MFRPGPWSFDDLEDALREFEATLHAARLQESSVRTYVDRSTRFVRWLVGEYEPRGPRG